VAWFIAKTLEEVGARCVYIVRSEARKQSLSRLLEGRDVFVCDVERPEEITAVREQIGQHHPLVHGILHSIAYAAYDEQGIRPFHETTKQQFLQSFDISCFSLISICNVFKDLLADDGAVVTISISTTTMASESYGFMAPIKAALDSSLVFLAKSFSRFSKVRFNAVAPSLLKTSASAGIPGYVDAYLYAEQVIPRREAVSTQEVANVACFLLSPRSSGIQARSIVIDAGMAINYFDDQLVSKVIKN
jgi:enoyl-[acyl-carrier protein] reductase I